MGILDEEDSNTYAFIEEYFTNVVFGIQELNIDILNDLPLFTIIDLLAEQVFDVAIANPSNVFVDGEYLFSIDCENNETIIYDSNNLILFDNEGNNLIELTTDYFEEEISKREIKISRVGTDKCLGMTRYILDNFENFNTRGFYMNFDNDQVTYQFLRKTRRNGANETFDEAHWNTKSDLKQITSNYLLELILRLSMINNGESFDINY